MPMSYVLRYVYEHDVSNEINGQKAASFWAQRLTSKTENSPKDLNMANRHCDRALNG